MSYKPSYFYTLLGGVIGITLALTQCKKESSNPIFFDSATEKDKRNFNIKLIDVKDGFPNVMFGPNVLTPPETDIEVYKIHNGTTNLVYSGVLWKEGFIFDSNFPKPLELVLKSDIFDVQGVSGFENSGLELQVKNEYTNGLDLLYVIDPKNKLREPKKDNSIIYSVPKSYIESTKKALKSDLELKLFERELMRKLNDLERKKEKKKDQTYI